ncbi:MAG: hypothetical protein EZS28_034686 [Streblomastix strix]|uniref:BZIP domain-containing protein n=1 Tax=Streblomastix strix TaxID=222440 RepID=A0A5J4UGI2_9EUKA|nr:MAG: hypothetical protein EZS28_034686 [Streblomastix strix]
MTAIETINETINETTQTESSQTDSFSSAKQGHPKKYTDKEQAMIAAREQRKNTRIRYKQNQTNYVSKVNDMQLLIIKKLKKIIVNINDLITINELIKKYDRLREDDQDINEDINDDIIEQINV